MGDSEKWKGSARTAPFLRKTYDMVDDPISDSVVSWSPNNSSFVIWNLPELVQDLLPKYFKHRNFSSFVRQLNTYGFRKVPERWEFANEGFVKGQKNLLKTIARRKPVQGLPQHANINNNDNDNDCIEVGSFGIQQEVEGLIKDKNVLSQQLVRLRKLQQSTDTRLHSVSQRVQLMDQTQQQMMSFLAIAMHSPALLSQLVHTQNDANLTKKRSLPTPDDDDDDDDNADALGLTTLRGSRQALKYQPLINEAAKAMLRQILKLNAHFPDHVFKDSNSFLLDLLPAASDLTDNANSVGRVSGVTLSEEPQTPREPCFSIERECSANHASGMNSKVHSSLCVTSDSANGVGIPDPEWTNPLEDAIMSDMNQMQGIVADSSLKFPTMTFSGTQDSALSFLDSLSSVQNETSPIEAAGCSPGAESDDILPGSSDAFWEQFFPVGPLSEATQEAEHDLEEDEGSEKLHHMNHLTEQLCLLTAEIENV